MRWISKIFGVLDEIAFRTKALTLNAAAEAARVSNRGRAFVIVATELRGLIQQTAATAHEIQELSTTSVDGFETGVVLVEHAGSKMARNVQSVPGVSRQIEQISAANRERASGIEQINIAVSQLARVRQQSAKPVEESTAAANSLSERARALGGVVAGFRISRLSGAHLR